MRNDGEVAFYQIEHQHKDETGWVLSSFDYFGAPHGDFQASGDVWQDHGHHGTYSQENGELALERISRMWPNRHFRLVRRTLSRKTEPILALSRTDLQIADPALYGEEHDRRCKALSRVADAESAQRTRK